MPIGIKEFFNYVNKKNGSTNGEIKNLKKRISALEKGAEAGEEWNGDAQAELADCRARLPELQKKLFNPIMNISM